MIFSELDGPRTTRNRWELTVMSDEHREDLAQTSAPALCLSKVYTGEKYRSQLSWTT
jgi:hypothetical protein